MNLARRQVEPLSIAASNDSRFGETGEVIGLELQKRLGELAITMAEYKRRVAVQLKGVKVGFTTDEEIDRLLQVAPREILDELESLWSFENGKWKGWKIQSGVSIDKIQKFVLSHL